MQGDCSIGYHLVLLVQEGKLEDVRNVITRFDLSHAPEWLDGYALLCCALQQEHTEIAKLLLENGSKVNSNNKKSSDTPLHFAVANGDTEIVQMLLNRHANIDAKNQYDSTPLYIAVELENMEISELLLSKGANIEAKGKEDYTPLLLAVEKGYEDIVDLLLHYGASIDAKNMYGKTALHIASQKGHAEIVKLLLKCDPKVDQS